MSFSYISYLLQLRALLDLQYHQMVLVVQHHQLDQVSPAVPAARCLLVVLVVLHLHLVHVDPEVLGKC